MDMHGDCLAKFPKLAALLRTFASNEGVNKQAATFPY